MAKKPDDSAEEFLPSVGKEPSYAHDEDDDMLVMTKHTLSIRADARSRRLGILQEGRRCEMDLRSLTVRAHSSNTLEGGEPAEAQTLEVDPQPTVALAPAPEAEEDAAEEPQHFCMEFWRATPEMLTLTKEERALRATEQLLLSSDGPFPAGALTETVPITWTESLAVQSFFLVTLGGPVMMAIILVAALVTRWWTCLAAWAVAVVVLAFHPLPRSSLECTWITLAFYKYFSFRMVWVDDSTQGIKEEQGWCGAGLPHGVFPIGSWLLGIASNAFCSGSHVGGAATVALYTPFLRYLMMFCRAIDVSASTIKRETLAGNCVGVVADGIAGIFTARDEVMLKNRKGLAKLSLQSGVPIIPVFNVGTTEVYDVIADSCGVLKNLSRLFRASLFLFWGRFGPTPRRQNIYALVGAAVVPHRTLENPEQEEVDNLHEKILDGIRSAFDCHKAACGCGERELKFI